jgi:hypothetical protein
MDQIIKLVQEKAGLSEDQARTAVSTVVDFLKDKLPAPIASQVDGVISGAGASGVLDQAGSLLGGMLGGNTIPGKDK